MMDSRSTSPGRTPESGLARVIELAGVRLAFGLDWHPVARPDHPRPEMRQARGAGYRLVANLPDGGLLGLARGLDAGRRAYSGVALLVTRFAERGAEACLIAAPAAGVAGERVAFVGLMDRRPVPGFDRLLPDLDAALTVLREFREMHPDQEVRVASHLPGRDRLGEALVPEMLFGQPDGDARLKPLLPARWPAALAGGIAVLGMAGGFAMWLRHERALERTAVDLARQSAAAAAARAAAAADRTRRLGQLLEAAGRPGSQPLDRWRTAVAALPLSRAGWTLQQVDCVRASGCVATWARHHGTLAALDTVPREHLGPPSMPGGPAAGENALASPMRTVLADTAEPPLRAGEALTTARLPPMRLALNVWGSRLQDLATVGGGDAAIHPGAALDLGDDTGAPRAPDAGAPVVRLTWHLKDGLWSLPLVQVPPYVVVETLTLNFAASQISYELSGSLFVHGSHY